MKASVIYQFGDPDALVYTDWAEPAVPPQHVLIRTACIGVNYADVHLRAGRNKKKVPPVVPGLDAAGEIVAVGEGVANLQVGQRVVAYAAQGSYCELMLAKAVLTYPLPDELSYEDASCLGSALTGYNVLHMVGRLTTDDTVVIHSAAGGVGSVCVQLARRLGARQIIGTVGSDAKREMVRKLGADVVLNYRTTNLQAAIMQLTNGQGVTLILDARGGTECEASLNYLAGFGRMVIYGQSSGHPAALLSNRFYKRNQAILGYAASHYRVSRPEALRPSAAQLLQLLAEGAVTNVIGGRFGLAEANEAHRLLESRQSKGKLVLLP